MQIYLPIAEISVDLFVLLGVGAGVGFLSGMFGVGGGFLVTPLLIFLGVPPGVAVSTGANTVVASSLSGTLAYWRRNAVDVRMGLLMTGGGAAGVIVGVQLFAILKNRGQIDSFIAISYVVFLSAIGGLMLFEALRAMRHVRAGGAPPRPPRIRFLDALPFKMRFERSGLYESAIPPVVIGFVVGMLASLMGVGGGFLAIPAMLYLLRMPTGVTIGTSLLQVTCVTGLTTVLQAAQNQTVDVLLAVCLIVSGVLGAQAGVRFGQKLPAERLRVALAGLVLLVGVKLAVDLVRTPAELFAILGAT